ncbi:hypothetical protein, partial [Agarivorans sp.]|uniref:hypothetical protein n=1 Tax=Agarivorans sp. TaxID=1872412 RepID=UPI003D020DE7
SESTTKCALAMQVLDNKNYDSIDEVYFNNGDTYGELMSALNESSKQQLLDNVAIRVSKYAALHYDGNIVPVLFEYVFSKECNNLYFSDSFKKKHSNLIDALNSLG